MPSAIPCPNGQLWFRTTHDYTIVQCCTSTGSAPLAANLGRNLWECFPGAEAKFGPIYAQALKEGMASGVVRYGGDIVSVHAFREPDSLLVTANAVTVEGLTDVIDAIHCELGEQPPTAPRLRLVAAG